MGVLARLERRLGGAVEGGFAKVFRSRVEPVELAVALKRECDEHKSIGPVQTLVPNDFVIDLGSSDHDRLAPYILTLADELADMVREHGHEQRYTFLGPVAIAFHRDPGLGTGTYRIGSRVEASDEPVRSGRPAPSVPPRPVMPPAAPPAPAASAVVPPAAPLVPPPVRAPAYDLTQAIPRATSAPTGHLELPSGEHVVIGAQGIVVGRGQEADVRLADASVSRRHAELALIDGRPTVVDLQSTNGTTVNGERVQRAVLSDGDRITFGAATITYRD